MRGKKSEKSKGGRERRGALESKREKNKRKEKRTNN